MAHWYCTNTTTATASKFADETSHSNHRRRIHSIPLPLAVQFLLKSSLGSLADCARRALCRTGRTSPSNASRRVKYC